MKTSWSLPGALKLTLLLLVVTTSLSHYSGFVTGSTQDICASIAANSPVNFFLIGRRSHSRLLITADYLVYELPSDSLQNDTVNMSSGVKPVPLSNYFPTLYQNETFQKLIYGQNDSEAKVFTSGSVHSSATHLRMVSIGSKLLFTFNMDTNDSDVNTNITVPRTVQQFVSASDAENLNASFYSFYSDDDGAKSFRMKYNLDSRKEMSAARQESTCKSTKGNITEMILRKAKKSCSDAPSYDAWNWTESFKGWTENLIDGNATVRYYLFDGTAQRVMIFDLFDVHIAQKDFNSTVSYKAYKDFFVCPKIAKVTTTLIPSTTSNQNHTASNLTTVTLVYNETSNTNASMETSSEKSKFPLWIIILIVVILLVVIIIIAAWYYYAGKKSSDSNKIASKEKLSNVKSSASSGKAASSVITSSKVLSTKVIPSKVASKVQSSKQIVTSANKVKASNSQMVKDGNTKLAGPKVSTTKQQSKVLGQNSKVGGVGGKAKASSNISPAADTAKLKAKSSAASKASIRSSMVAPSKGPGASKVQGLKAKK